MTPRIVPTDARAELQKLIASTMSQSAAAGDVDRLIARLSGLSPKAIHEVEAMLGALPWTAKREFRRAWSVVPSGPISELEPANAALLMFNRSGFVREAALRAIDRLPDTPFFVAALVWRLNDWVQQVRRATEDCALRVLPGFSSWAIVGAAPFLLERIPHWGRWAGTPSVVLDALARHDCVAELALRFETEEIPARALREALRLALLDDHLLPLWRRAKRPEFRAIALKALIDGEINWIAHYEREWVDKRYGITRNVPVLARRPISRPMPVDALIIQGAADRSSMVRRVAASGLVRHAADIANVKQIISLFAGDRSPGVRWRMDYLARRE
jgi:hypothetical protein